MSVSGVINTHFIVAYMLKQHGTQEQKERLLPLMATGELRGGFSMSEPGCGSDVAAIKSKGVRDGEDYVLDGQKMWLTNGARAGIIATLVKTDEGADSVYKNMTTFLVEKEPGFGETAPGSPSPARSTRWATRASRPPRWSWRAPACRPPRSSAARRAAARASTR
jgi:alkylation response protein AidB-like acyl-CoA dehydrogenase